EATVVVLAAPRGRRPGARIGHSGLRSHVGEVSGPVVLVEAVDTVVDDVEIRVAIAVVIDELRSHPHSPPVVDAAAGRLVAEVPRRVLDPQLGGPLLIWNVQ